MAVVVQLYILKILLMLHKYNRFIAKHQILLQLKLIVVLVNFV